MKSVYVVCDQYSKREAVPLPLLVTLYALVPVAPACGMVGVDVARYWSRNGPASFAVFVVSHFSWAGVVLGCWYPVFWLVVVCWMCQEVECGFRNEVCVT